MKRLRNIIGSSLLALSMIGCSSANQESLLVRVEGRIDKDLVRTSEIAAEFNKPQVKICADFLAAKLREDDLSGDNLDKLMNIETEGIASLALKNALIAEYVRNISSGANQAQFRVDFDKNCSAVAGQMMLNIMRDGADIAKKIR